MSNLIEAIKTLKTSQRLGALVFLALLTSITSILTVYFKTDDCRVIIDENVRMHEDFAKISSMLREVRMKNDTEVESTIEVDSLRNPYDTDKKPKIETEKIIVPDYSILDSIETITNKHSK